jgi:N-formylglutamate deformylase
MTIAGSRFVEVVRGGAPLIVSVPHAGTHIPAAHAARLVLPWLARKDADWWMDRLCDSAAGLGATVIRTSLSRTMIDVNRDPSGRALYSGQVTTELCPTTTFDGEPLYHPGQEPGADEIARRTLLHHQPYHAAIQTEIARLRERFPHIVLYDAHSIRSVIPRLFDGTLPHLNLGTYDGVTCAPELEQAFAAICAGSGFDWVLNGRFKGGFITRSFGAPDAGVHALQVEMACRTYLQEPIREVSEANWPASFEPNIAAPARAIVDRLFRAALDFAA